MVVPAEMAAHAGDMMLHGNAVAEAELFDAAADFGDDPRGFVSEDARRGEEAVVDFFYVGRADAADGDFDEEFAGFDFRHGDGFEPEVIDPAIDDGPHGFGHDYISNFHERTCPHPPSLRRAELWRIKINAYGMASQGGAGNERWDGAFHFWGDFLPWVGF